ncbi:mCG1035250 [Mus musculus]|nr:mCG1035250 [Mus musculus]
MGGWSNRGRLDWLKSHDVFAAGHFEPMARTPACGMFLPPFKVGLPSLTLSGNALEDSPGVLHINL